MKLVLFFGLVVSSIIQRSDAYDAIEINHRNAYYKQGDFRYQVFINHDCHGAIITSRFVLTVAHCVANYVNGQIKPKPLKSLVIHTLSIEVVRPNSFHFKVARIIVHPDFLLHTYKTPFHDVALVQTYIPFDFSGTIAPVRLANYRPSANITVIIPVHAALDDSRKPKAFQNKLYATAKSKDYQQCTRFQSTCAEYLLCVHHSYGKKVVFAEPGVPATINSQLVGMGCGKYRSNAFVSIAPYYDWIRANSR